MTNFTIFVIRVDPLQDFDWTRLQSGKLWGGMVGCNSKPLQVKIAYKLPNYRSVVTPEGEFMANVGSSSKYSIDNLSPALPSFNYRNNIVIIAKKHCLDSFFLELLTNVALASSSYTESVHRWPQVT